MKKLFYTMVIFLSSFSLPMAGPTNSFDPATAHDELLTESAGYFEYASGNGGDGGSIVYVQNLNNSGTGSLREAMTLSGAKIVLFEDSLDGTITLDSSIDVTSDKTLWGRHRNGTAADIFIKANVGTNTSALFKVSTGVSDVIFANLRMEAKNGIGQNNPDAIQISGGDTVWVHHVTAHSDGTNVTDGFVDVTLGGTDVTVSWCRTEGWFSPHLVNDAAHVTFHHNLWEGADARAPRSTGTNTHVHAYNNWLQNWGNAGMNAQFSGELRAENNAFTPDAGSDLDEAIKINDGGLKVESGNVYDGGSSGEACVSCSVFTPPYSYTADTSNQTMRDNLSDHAGWQHSVD